MSPFIIVTPKKGIQRKGLYKNNLPKIVLMLKTNINRISYGIIIYVIGQRHMFVRYSQP